MATACECLERPARRPAANRHAGYDDRSWARPWSAGDIRVRGSFATVRNLRRKARDDDRRADACRRPGRRGHIAAPGCQRYSGRGIENCRSKRSASQPARPTGSGWKCRTTWKSGADRPVVRADQLPGHPAGVGAQARVEHRPAVGPRSDRCSRDRAGRAAGAEPRTPVLSRSGCLAR